MSTEPTPRRAGTAARRKRWLAVAIGAFALIGIAYGAYWASTCCATSQSTDDAYVDGNVVQITPQVAGTVVAIGADDTQFVKAGQTLVQLDPADAKIALEQSRGAARQDGARSARPVRDDRAAARRRRVREVRSRARDRRPRAARAPRERRRRLGRGAAACARRARQRARRRSPPRSSSSPRIARGSTARPSPNHPDVLAAAAQRARRLPRLRAHAAARAGLGLRRQAQRAARPAREPRARR